MLSPLDVVAKKLFATLPCPAGTMKQGFLCVSLCETKPAPNNGMHPTPISVPLLYVELGRG